MVEEIEESLGSWLVSDFNDESSVSEIGGEARYVVLNMKSVIVFISTSIY